MLIVVCLDPPEGLGLTDRLISSTGDGEGEGRLLFEV